MLNQKLHLTDKLFKKDIARKEIRDGFGEGLVMAGEVDERVVVLTADLADSTRSSYFKEKFPDRFFEVGVSEQNLVAVASGMANYGKIPFISSYAIFSPGRNWELVRTAICLNNVPVKIIGSHAGLSAGPDGANHQTLEDIALMRVLPKMVVEVPCDANEAKKAVLEALNNGKPTYIRTQKFLTPLVTSGNSPYKIGTAEDFWESKEPQVSIIACGPLVYEALKAAKTLKKIGIESEVLNCHTLKPIDKQAIIHAAKIAGAIVTVEEHQVVGGLGGAVSEILSENFPVPIEFVGIWDAFAESGKPDELLKKFQLTREGIVDAVKKVIKKKNS